MHQKQTVNMATKSNMKQTPDYDDTLNFPVLDPALPLEEVLEYRQKHDATLRQARDKLVWMARGIETEPWIEEFAREIEHKVIPDIANELDEARKARDAWLKSKRSRYRSRGRGSGAVSLCHASHARSPCHRRQAWGWPRSARIGWGECNEPQEKRCHNTNGTDVIWTIMGPGLDERPRVWTAAMDCSGSRGLPDRWGSPRSLQPTMGG